MKPGLRMLLWLGGALVLLVNVVALAGVAYNRGSEPGSQLTLGERELRLPPVWRANSEDSSLALALSWRVATDSAADGTRFDYEPSAHAPVDWLDAVRLEALGFEPPNGRAGERSFRQPRAVWLALEFDGPAHARDLQQAQEALSQAQGAVAAHPGDDEHRKRAEDADKRFLQVRDEWSRLVAIDADLDADALRARHPDRTRVAIVRGRVRPSWRYREPYASGRGEWRGHIEAVAVDRIHVPLAQRGLFDPLLGPSTSERHDRYRATVAWGRRAEPWIVATERSNGASQ